MNKGFPAKVILLLGISVSFSASAWAEVQPKPKPVDIEVEPVAGEVLHAASDEWIPLPVPKPVMPEIVEIEAGSGLLAYSRGGNGAGAVVVTATTTAMPADPADPAGLRQMVAQEAETNGVAAALADAVVRVESSYNPKALGGAGEIGLMQIKPETARLLGFRGPDAALFHPATNLRWGMKYLAEAQRKSGGTVCGTILRYNAGHGAKQMNPVSEAYCQKVKALLRGDSV